MRTRFLPGCSGSAGLRLLKQKTPVHGVPSKRSSPQLCCYLPRSFESPIASYGVNGLNAEPTAAVACAAAGLLQSGAVSIRNLTLSRCGTTVRRYQCRLCQSRGSLASKRRRFGREKTLLDSPLSPGKPVESCYSWMPLLFLMTSRFLPATALRRWSKRRNGVASTPSE